MTDMYTGWDGKSYPWPPPEGWYEASDGRWWAPGTGPNPPPQAHQPSPHPAATSSPPPMSEPAGQTTRMPTFGAPGAATGDGGGDDGTRGYDAPTGGYDPAQAGVTAPAGAASTSAPTAVPGAPPSGPGSQWSPPPTSSGGTSRLLLVGLGALAAIAIAAGVFFVARDSGDTAASEDTTTTSDTTDATDEPTTSSVTSTTAETSTTVADEPTTLADTTAQVAEFRAILTENNLTSDDLSDDDISTFGSTFCIFAVASESQTEYMAFRDEAITDTDSELSEDELFLVIDAAVLVFCPEEANRLGISVPGA